MRWLVAHPGPGFSVHDVYAGWVEGLREVGEQVHEFNLGDRLAFYDCVLLPVPGRDDAFHRALPEKVAIEHAVNGLAAALFKVRPDVLLIVSGFFTDHQMLDQARRAGTCVILLCTESPYEDARQLRVAEHSDLVMLNDPVNKARFEQVAPTIYAPHAYRPTVHRPGESGVDPCDLGFVGTGYPSRVEFFEGMDLAGLDVVLGGNWQRVDETSPVYPHVGHALGECVDNADAADLYRAARCGINLYRREADDDELLSGVAMGPREVEMAACGLFFLRDPRQESDEVLGMLPSFDGPGEAGELLRWYLDRPQLRQELAMAARGAIVGRTFVGHAARLLRLLDRQPVSTS